MTLSNPIIISPPHMWFVRALWVGNIDNILFTFVSR